MLNHFLSRKPYKTIHGIPSFVQSLSGEDKKWNRFYNFFAPFYDLSERVLGGLLTGVNIVKERQRLVKALSLSQGDTLLEVSPGPGVFQKDLTEAIGPKGTLVSLDLSLGMLLACKKNALKQGLHPYLIHGNGDDLPFYDEAFDVLFNVGSINLFTHPEKALKEFARVVKPGGLIIIGDEGFRENLSKKTWRQQCLIRMNPGFLKTPPQLPKEMERVSMEWFFGGMQYLIVAKKRKE